MNNNESLEKALSRLLPSSIQWLLDEGYVNRTYEGKEVVISISERGHEYFNKMRPIKGGRK